MTRGPLADPAADAGPFDPATTGWDSARRVRRAVPGLANTGRRRGRKWLTGRRVRLTVAGVSRVMPICAGGVTQVCTITHVLPYPGR